MASNLELSCERKHLEESGHFFEALRSKLKPTAAGVCRVVDSNNEPLTFQLRNPSKRRGGWNPGSGVNEGYRCALLLQVERIEFEKDIPGRVGKQIGTEE